MSVRHYLKPAFLREVQWISLSLLNTFKLQTAPLTFFLCVYFKPPSFGCRVYESSPREGEHRARPGQSRHAHPHRGEDKENQSKSQESTARLSFAAFLGVDKKKNSFRRRLLCLFLCRSAKRSSSTASRSINFPTVTPTKMKTLSSKTVS